jgi:hypothetical protein
MKITNVKEDNIVGHSRSKTGLPNPESSSAIKAKIAAHVAPESDRTDQQEF